MEKLIAAQTRDKLFVIENYSILMQYLAIGNNIVINNGVTDIDVWMDQDFNIFALNLDFKGLPPYNYSAEMTLKNVIFGIVPQLKKQKSEFKKFENKWEEIKVIMSDTIGFNKYKEFIDQD